MAKTEKQATPNCDQETLMSWLASLRAVSVTPDAIALHLADWISTSYLGGIIAPGEFGDFCQRQLAIASPTSPRLWDIVLAGCYAATVEEHDETITRLASFHLALAERMDNQQTGLLGYHSQQESSVFYPSVQAAWIWSAGKLLKILKHSDYAAQLFQLTDLYCYETNQQLRVAQEGYYTPLASTEKQAFFSIADNALPMLALIPDQDKAEEILKWLERHAAPWANPALFDASWLGSAAYLMYHALQCYEMYHEADLVKQYVARHQLANPLSSQAHCLYWLWQNEQ